MTDNECRMIAEMVAHKRFRELHWGPTLGYTVFIADSDNVKSAMWDTENDDLPHLAKYVLERIAREATGEM